MRHAWPAIALLLLVTCSEEKKELSYCEALFQCFQECGSTSSTCEFECADDPCESGDNACVQARETSLDYARSWFECEEDGADCANDARNCRAHEGPYEVIERPE